MAKYECCIKTDLDELMTKIEDAILDGSASATLEEKSDFEEAGIRCCVRLFERYSMIGGNRDSLNITFFKTESDRIFISATSTGGSQAVLIKINNLGEKAFLKEFCRVLEDNYSDVLSEIDNE